MCAAPTLSVARPVTQSRPASSHYCRVNTIVNRAPPTVWSVTERVFAPRVHVRSRTKLSAVCSKSTLAPVRTAVPAMLAVSGAAPVTLAGRVSVPVVVLFAAMTIDNAPPCDNASMGDCPVGVTRKVVA